MNNSTTGSTSTTGSATNLDDIVDKSDICNLVLTEYADSNKALADKGKIDLVFANVSTIYDKLVSGETVTSICKHFGISRTTWYYIVNNSEHFARMIELAKQEQVEMVKSSLINKTQDKYVIAEKVLPNGSTVEYRKFVPSDFNAIKFYLLNKAGDEYKDKQEIQISKKEYVIDIIEP